MQYALSQALSVRNVDSKVGKRVGKNSRTVVVFIPERETPQLLPDVFRSMQLVSDRS